MTMMTMTVTVPSKTASDDYSLLPSALEITNLMATPTQTIAPHPAQLTIATNTNQCTTPTEMLLAAPLMVLPLTPTKLRHNQTEQ